MILTYKSKANSSGYGRVRICSYFEREFDNKKADLSVEESVILRSSSLGDRSSPAWKILLNNGT